VTELRGITWDHVRGWSGLRAAALAYERERGIRVTWDTRPLRAFAERPADELATYDLIVLDHPSIGGAVARAALVPLDVHLDETILREQAAGTVGRSFESYTWEGHQWALPVDATAQVTAVRPDLLGALDEDVPTTWDGWRSLAAVCRRRDLWITIPAIRVDAICAFLAACVAHGSEPFAEDGRVVEPGAGREALRTLRAVIEVAHPASLTSNPPAAFQHMSRHDDVVGCPLAFGYVNHATPGFAPHELRFAPGPAGDDGTGRGTLGGAGIAVSSSSTSREAAVSFAAYVTSPEVQRTIYVEAGGQPGHRAAWTDGAVNHATGSFFADTLAALDAAYLRPRAPGFLSFQDRAGGLVQAYLRQGGDVQSVLRGLDEIARDCMPMRVER
jgi:multiple sugar transport system substrate-binding protein